MTDIVERLAQLERENEYFKERLKYLEALTQPSNPNRKNAPMESIEAELRTLRSQMDFWQTEYQKAREVIERIL